MNGIRNLSGLLLNGQPIKVGEGGYLGSFNVRDQFTIELEFPGCFRAWWVFDENFDNIQLKRDVAPEHNVFDKKMFIKHVSVLFDGNKNVTTLPKQNHINVLEKTPERGVLRAKEISIVAQNEKFFLVEQVNFVTVYRDAQNLPVFPEADTKKWQELLGIIFPESEIGKLKPISEYKTVPPKLNFVGTNVGVILHWRISNGTGVVLTEKGVKAKIYWGAIQMPGFKKLEIGDIVRFSAIEKIWNRKEGAVLEFQALGVRIVI